MSRGKIHIRFAIVGLATAFMVFCFSCNEDINLEDEDGYEFFPLTTSSFWLYEVKEVLIVGSVPDTLHYFLREEIADTIQNGDIITYLINRYKSADSLTIGDLDSVWSVRKTSSQLVVTENNVPFVKLIFPVRVGASWNGNALNTREEATYLYREIESFLWQGEAVESSDAIELVIADLPENLVEQDQRTELYVRNVGLMRKDYISVSFCQPGSGCEELGVIDQGRILRQDLIAYGE